MRKIFYLIPAALLLIGCNGTQQKGDSTDTDSLQQVENEESMRQAAIEDSLRQVAIQDSIAKAQAQAEAQKGAAQEKFVKDFLNCKKTKSNMQKYCTAQLVNKIYSAFKNDPIVMDGGAGPEYFQNGIDQDLFGGYFEGYLKVKSVVKVAENTYKAALSAGSYGTRSRTITVVPNGDSWKISSIK